MINIDPSEILVRYNVKVEKEQSPEEIAKELFPEDMMIRSIIEAVFEGDEDDVIDALETAIQAGSDPLSLIDDALMPGMGIVSKLYDEGILFLPDVIISAHAMTDGIEYCKQMSSEVHEFKGRVVSFVVEGDMHDIGKKIVTVLLRANGYEVIDLGSDVLVSEVINAVKREKPIMLSGTALMTTTMYSFKEINNLLLENNIRIPFVCGGGAVKQDFVFGYELGVYCEEAADAPKIADDILKGAGVQELREKFHRH
ncbi:methanol--corrinoid protein MtaC [Methanomethylovorans sp.]|uniref:methanol--corrinoid protein MtaC n=1 Tax=Methanomethylovorans sp. TaxID=2758717 RepID=UPI002FDE59B4